MELQPSYEIMFGYVQELQIAHLISLKTINIVTYDRFSKPSPLTAVDHNLPFPLCLHASI